MHLISLQSGSNGNCIYVESQGVRLLFDAGLAPAQVAQRLAGHGRSAVGADGLFISHEHYDHVRCAGAYARHFEVPLYLTQKTCGAARRYLLPAGKMDVQHFRAGSSVKIGHLTVETIATPHDAVDGVVFVVDDGQHRLGICTDVGHAFADLKSVVKTSDALFLESNYDEAMLSGGPYPPRLKKRINGSRGHISNNEAAHLVAENASDRLQWLCLAHLSERNNTQRKALATHRELLGELLPIEIATRHRATGVLALGAPTGLATLARQQLTFDF